MNIIKSTPDLNKKDLYKLTRSPESKPMKDAVGEELHVAAFAIYEDERADGKGISTVTSILTTDGQIYGTNSDTFRREFDYITELMGDDDTVIKVIQGVTKNDREFITCSLV